MTLYFNHVFPGIGLRGLQEDNQDFVDGGSLPGIDDFTIGEAMGSQGQRVLPGPEQGGGDRFRGRTADPDYPYAALSERGGDGGNGIFVNSVAGV
jgi:hypothetical protein